MEAGSGAHDWGRELRQLGHEVRLMSPHDVKPSRTGDQTNPNDAAASGEAVSRPHMRFVALKSLEQQDRQALPRIREPLVKARTALVNQLRGWLAADGLVIPQGMAKVGQGLPRSLEEAEHGLTTCARALCAELSARLRTLNDQMTDAPQRIERLCTHHPGCQTLTTLRGSVRWAPPRSSPRSGRRTA